MVFVFVGRGAGHILNREINQIWGRGRRRVSRCAGFVGRISRSAMQIDYFCIVLLMLTTLFEGTERKRNNANAEDLTNAQQFARLQVYTTSSLHSTPLLLHDCETSTSIHRG